MMSRHRSLCVRAFVALVLAYLTSPSFAEDAGGNDDGNGGNYNGNYYYNQNGNNNGNYYYNNANNYQQNANDDGMQNYGNNNYMYDNNNQNQNQGDSIQYWTDYAIYPKRCIVYNNVDVIVFSVFDEAYNHCSDDPVGTYITPVPYFVQGYLQQEAQDMYDQGYDYQMPEVSQYAYCTPYQTENQILYFQLGCSDASNQELAVNIYEDNACTVRSQVDGYDDSNIDVSAVQLPFKKCEACVNWFDMDEQADDQYYEMHQLQAPLCSTAWSYRQDCGRKCRHTGMETGDKHRWNTSDKVLLAILTVFALIMVGLIVRQRQKMSNKDALLEQAALSAAGLQQPHVVGLCVLVVLVIVIFALLGLKNITWALLLLINTALFGYLMKLTVDSGVSTGETVIGPDGTILRQDSDDSSVEDSSKGADKPSGIAAIFTLPTIT